MKNFIGFYLEDCGSRGPFVFADIEHSLPDLDTDLIKNSDFKDAQTLIYDVEPVKIYCENSNDVYNYEYYKILYFDNSTYFFNEDINEYPEDSECIYYRYIAIPIDN